MQNIKFSDPEIFLPLQPGTQLPVAFIQSSNTGLRRTYGVKICWQIEGNIETVQMQYRISCLKRTDEIYLWEISKQYFFVNGFLSDNPMDELAIACAKILYPIKFWMAANGIIPKLDNGTEIKERFATNKPLLERDFKGSVAKKYFDKIEHSLQTPSELDKVITQDIWLCLFLTPLSGRYNNFERLQTINIPFWGAKPRVTFIGSSTVKDQLTEWKTKTVTFEGKLDLETLPAQIKYDYQPISGEMKLTYDLDETNHRIQNILCEASITTQAHGKINLNLTGYQQTDAIEKDVPVISKLKEKPWKWYSIFDI